jgi:hypothetical protein
MARRFPSLTASLSDTALFERVALLKAALVELEPMHASDDAHARGVAKDLEIAFAFDASPSWHECGEDLLELLEHHAHETVAALRVVEWMLAQ